MKLHIQNSKGYALLIAILPVIMMYQVPGIELGAATVLIGLGMIYAGFVMLIIRDKFLSAHLVLFCLYFIYAMLKSDGINILLCIAILIHFIAISMDTVNSEFLRKTVETISVIAAICVVLQFAFHTLTGNHIQMINLNWCLSEMEQYTSVVTTGIPPNEAMYRPSAFFLEPSHLANYTSVGLVSCLLMGEPKYIKALIISLGVICSTSGIGIVLVAGIWGVFPFLSTKGIDNKKIKRIIVLGAVLLIAFIILYQMPFFQNALNRILGGASYSSTQYNAIWGRILYWNVYITPMEGKDLFFGYGSDSLPEVYFTGIMKIIYSYGLLGVLLLYAALLFFCIKSKNNGCRLLIGIYGALLIFANLTNFITMIFYLGSIMALFKYTKKDFEVLKMVNK